ncbi:MAG: DUF6384 family protein [Gammaproteobacteria bacterium]
MSDVVDKPPLEDLMVAMDVVDTLRHRQQLVDRELDSEGRRERLVARLREIYSAQGIEVTNEVLADGVRALEEDRFTYTPPADTFGMRMAKIYVRRDKWLGPILFLLALLCVLWLAYYLVAIRPAAEARAELPGELAQQYAQVIQSTEDAIAHEQAGQYRAAGQLALEDAQYDDARDAIDRLAQLRRQLGLAFTLQVISRPGEQSGVWRVPDVNTGARNYYLIVEAVDARGEVLSLPITSEETGKTTVVKTWGLRVDASEFERIRADKQDDGIIQERDVARKQPGQLNLDYRIRTSGAAITSW